jgi:hypothetical protein
MRKRRAAPLCMPARFKGAAMWPAGHGNGLGRRVEALKEDPVERYHADPLAAGRSESCCFL